MGVFILLSREREREKERMWQSLGLTVLVIVATLICVLLFMLFGKNFSFQGGPYLSRGKCLALRRASEVTG